jgi:hypothetical protein
MDLIQRQTIIFFLPISIDALTDDQSPYTASKDGSAFWDKRQLYINPQSISIRDAKLVKPDLTKGGFVVQYWGEQLPVMEVQGVTGSAGIAGINVLKDIYRHEQIQYRQVLADRQAELATAALAAAEAAASELSSPSNVGESLTLAADVLTGGAFSSAVSGVSNAIDIITDPFSGGTSFGDTYGGSGTFTTIPTLASFATNVDLYHQGEFFRGFFTGFNVTETANEPGHFSYTFSFTVTRRTGKRENFMPWHREPTDAAGETIMSQKTTEEKGAYPGNTNLSFETEITRRGQLFDEPNIGYVSSEFVEPIVDVEDLLNETPVSRRSQAKGE